MTTHPTNRHGDEFHLGSSFGSNANSVGTANAPGSSSSNTHMDHVHQGVHQISAAGSNALFGDVNVAAGSGIAVTLAGQSVTIAATGTTGGSGTLTTIEEADGSPTDSAVTKLVFPNGTLAIASHVATYTPASSSSGMYNSSKAFFQTIPASHATEDDEFEDLTSQSGPLNGLAGKWSKRNLVTGVTLTLDDAQAGSCLIFDIATATQDQILYQTAPAGDFRLTCRFSMFYNLSGRHMFGLVMLDTSGNGVGVDVDNGGSAVIRTVDAWQQSGTATALNPDYGGASRPFSDGFPVNMSLRKSGNSYFGGLWLDDRVLAAAKVEQSITRTFTIAYVGFGRIFAGSANQVKVALDFFRKS